MLLGSHVQAGAVDEEMLHDFDLATTVSVGVVPEVTGKTSS